jgi:hypothetical protein
VGEHTTGAAERWGGRTVRWGVAGAVAVAAGCAGLLVLERLGPDRGSSSSDCGGVCQAGSTFRSPAPGAQGPAGTTPATGRTPSGQPAPSGTPSAATSSAPVSASALVQFKVTSHWDDGYRADVTITDAGPAPLTGWHLTFHVTGAHLHQPTDTDEAAMAGDVVTVTPAGWRQPLARGAQAVFGMGSDGVLAAPGGCELDGAPCELQYVNAVPGQ